MKSLISFLLLILVSCKSGPKNGEHKVNCKEKVIYLFSKYDLMTSFPDLKESEFLNCEGSNFRTDSDLLLYLNEKIIEISNPPPHVITELNKLNEKLTMFLIVSILDSSKEEPISSKINIISIDGK